MKTITIEVPDDTALPFGDSDEQFARELRLAAAIFWYDRGLISQGKARRNRGTESSGFPGRFVPREGARMPGHHRRAEGGARIVATPVRRIVNTSPLILLAKVGQLDLLRAGVPEIIVPDVVLREVGGRGPADPVFQEIQRAAWLKIVPTPPTPPRVLVWNLGAGESSVLAIALTDPATDRPRCGHLPGSIAIRDAAPDDHADRVSVGHRLNRACRRLAGRSNGEGPDQPVGGRFCRAAIHPAGYRARRQRAYPINRRPSDIAVRATV